VLKQWVALKAEAPSGETVLAPLYEVIHGNVHKLYSGMKLTGTTLFRVTRDAEFEIDDESDAALQDIVREQVRQRRYEPVLRLEFAPGADPSIREMLRERFGFRCGGRLRSAR
jgi:polyphosphate kinase